MLDTKRKALWKQIRDEVLEQACVLSRSHKYEDGGKSLSIYVNLPANLSDETSLCDQLSHIEKLKVVNSSWKPLAAKVEISKRIEDMKLQA
jgi:hypothetical protein